MPGSLRLKGRLDAEALEQALLELTRRHETLRTTFRFADGQPEQVISFEPAIALEKVDLRALPAVVRDKEVARLTDEQSRKPFDLVSGPLFRATLYQLDDEDHIMHSNMHHIIADYWSFGIMIREFAELYRAFVVGKPARLPDMPVQYADFAYCQRKWLQGEVLDAHLTYWKEKLGGELASLDLPTDRPRPAIQTHRGARESLIVDQGVVEALRELSRRQGASLFMVFLAAFKALLVRTTGQEDILVGTPIAGRNRTETEGVIGCFINTIVMRNDLSGNPTFKELLGRVRKTALEAYAHQEMPFEKIVEELAPKRNLSHTPLFQVFFNYVVAENYHAELPGSTAEFFGDLEYQSKFDITLYVWEQGNAICLAALYNADIFDAERMRAMLSQYRGLLTQIADDSAKPIRSYSLVTPEVRAILPDPALPLPRPVQRRLPEMFAAWAGRTPEQTALVHGDHSLSYAQLCRRARALSTALRNHGAQNGDVVGVCGPRSFGLIVGIMAAFFNSNVLLPIDGGLPGPRQRVMLREARAKFLLFVRGAESGAQTWEPQTDPNVRLIELDPEGLLPAAAEADPQTGLEPQPDGGDAAYIIFTSGTTGIPKGVLGSHQGLSHFLDWQREAFGVVPTDRVSQFTSLSFDPVLREIFLPLTSGATLCLPDEINILAGNEVFSWLARERISILHTVPTLAENWLATAPTDTPVDSLRRVFFAGEPLTGEVARKWRGVFPQAEIINLYGPTETTLAKCFFRVPYGMPSGIQPLGSPLPQTQALVLTEDHRLCGVGETGEIVLRTPFRSLGYVNNEEEHRRRFIRNPFREDDADVVYLTGDMGRYRPDGMIEFLGRADDQIKIRGVRVEPGEIVAALANHPRVESCFVTGREERGRTCLAAYVVVDGHGGVTVSELKTFLGQRLPAAMVPEAFVFLEALPLTPRGKIDRRALPSPGQGRPELEDIFVAPRNRTESLLAGIWEEVLGRRQIGVRDDFFVLGGHSLLATQVMSRLNRLFNVKLPLRKFFESRTIEALAEALAASSWNTGAANGPDAAGNEEQEIIEL
jgi:amino acid adenylation domain-containing protein